MVYICTGPAGKVIHSSTASDGSEMPSSYPYINGTHTFFKLTLAAGPGDVTAEAKKDSKNNIATAYAELMKLNHFDVGFSALNKIYSLANREYYRGNIFYNKALLASGNKANFYYAKAATAYTRSQAHALQVYEALVPAPTSPADLGLKPFGGEWAQWETKVGKIK